MDLYVIGKPVFWKRNDISNVDNNVKNLRAAIPKHSDISLAAWNMVTNLTSLSTPSHRCSLLINLCNLSLE
jgi:hypothetical protein